MKTKITTIMFLLKEGWNQKAVFSTKPDIMNRVSLLIPVVAIILGLVRLIMPETTNLMGFNWYAPVEYAIFMFAMNICSLAVIQKKENAYDILFTEKIDEIHFLFVKIFWFFLSIMVINLIVWIIFSLVLKMY
jgi:hypothetical protein